MKYLRKNSLNIFCITSAAFALSVSYTLTKQHNNLNKVAEAVCELYTRIDQMQDAINFPNELAELLEQEKNEGLI